MSRVNRRRFVEQSAATAASAALTAVVCSTVAVRAQAASRRVRVGVIGCGGQGRGAHIGGLLANENVEIVYVCDPDEQRRGQATEAASGAKPIGDLRTILDDPSIDGVTIATPDHWHTPAALLAMEAGKHVYVEKPCSHNLREGQLLVAAAQRTGQVVQHGTQARSDPGMIEAVQMLREGIIGDVLVARAWNVQRRESIGRAQPSDPPAGFDYDQWVGPAPMVPFQSNRHHYSWHWWHDFGTGDVGNDGVHEVDMARWGLGVEQLPTQVAVAGGKYFFDDDQQFPDTVTATFDFVPGEGAARRRQLVFEMRLWSSNYPEGVDGGIEFLGTEGRMFFSRRGKFQLWGPRNRPRDERLRQDAQMSVAENLRTWLAAIRGEGPATADARTAHQSAALCHLANISVRVGRSLRVDPASEQIVNDQEANRLLTREYRVGHWAAPDVRS